MCACFTLCAEEMKGTAPAQDILELFSLARSRLDAPLLGSFLNSGSDTQAAGAAGPATASVEVTRMVASIARPSTGKIHQLAKSVLQERNDSRWVLSTARAGTLFCADAAPSIAFAQWGQKCVSCLLQALHLFCRSVPSAFAPCSEKCVNCGKE